MQWVTMWMGIKDRVPQSGAQEVAPSWDGVVAGLGEEPRVLFSLLGTTLRVGEGYEGDAGLL